MCSFSNKTWEGKTKISQINQLIAKYKVRMQLPIYISFVHCHCPILKHHNVE